MKVPATMGGGIRFPDFSNVQKSGFTAEETYVAQCDGWLTGLIIFNSTQGGGSAVYVNNNVICSVYSGSPTATIGVLTPVEKGSTIKTNSYGTYSNLKYVGTK